VSLVKFGGYLKEFLLAATPRKEYKETAFKNKVLSRIFEPNRVEL
jgi:hypothetical protein